MSYEEKDDVEIFGDRHPNLQKTIGCFGNRLKEVMRGEGARGFSRKCELSEGAIRSYLNGASYPTLDRLERIAAAAGVDMEWLAFGRKGDSEQGGAGSASALGEQADEFAYVEQMAGSSGVISRRHAVRRDWLAAQGLEPSRLNVMETREDSMAPTIQPGDLLLCETYTHHPDGKIKMGLAPGELPPQDGIYMIRRGDRGPMSLRRLRLDMAGGMFIFADADTSLYLHATGDVMADISILARVVSLQRLV